MNSVSIVNLVSAAVKTNTPGSPSVSLAQRLTGALRPISDTYGSHADTQYALFKNHIGTDQSLPMGVMNSLDSVSPFFSRSYEASWVHTGIQALKDIPSKVCGSLRQIMAGLDKILSVAYDLLADAYNGLMSLITDLIDLLDKGLSKVFDWIITGIGKLIDMAFPDADFSGITEGIMSIADFFVDIGDLLMGHGAIQQIGFALGSIGAALQSTFSSSEKMTSIFTSLATIADVVGGLAGASVGCANTFGAKATKIANKLRLAATITGLFSNKNSNFEIALKNLIPTGFGDIIENLKNVTASDIILAILPPELANNLKRIDQLCCGAGKVGDMGFSVGGVFDNYRNTAYEKAISDRPQQAGIFSAMFGKKAESVNGYGGIGYSGPSKVGLPNPSNTSAYAPAYKSALSRTTTWANQTHVWDADYWR